MPGQRAEGVIAANISVSRALWKAALGKAQQEGRSLSSVISGWLAEYVGDQGTAPPQ